MDTSESDIDILDFMISFADDNTNSSLSLSLSLITNKENSRHGK